MSWKRLLYCSWGHNGATRVEQRRCFEHFVWTLLNHCSCWYLWISEFIITWPARRACEILVIRRAKAVANCVAKHEAGWAKRSQVWKEHVVTHVLHICYTLGITSQCGEMRKLLDIFQVQVPSRCLVPWIPWSCRILQISDEFTPSLCHLCPDWFWSWYILNHFDLYRL